MKNQRPGSPAFRFFRLITAAPTPAATSTAPSPAPVHSLDEDVVFTRCGGAIDMGVRATGPSPGTGVMPEPSVGGVGVADGDERSCPDTGGMTDDEPIEGASVEALPEIWVVRGRTPICRTVEDVADPKGFLTLPGTKVPRIEEPIFGGLAAGLAAGRLTLPGRAAPGAETGSARETHSSTSTYQTAVAGDAGTCSNLVVQTSV